MIACADTWSAMLRMTGITTRNLVNILKNMRGVINVDRDVENGRENERWASVQQTRCYNAAKGSCLVKRVANGFHSPGSAPLLYLPVHAVQRSRCRYGFGQRWLALWYQLITMVADGIVCSSSPQLYDFALSIGGQKLPHHGKSDIV